MPDQDSSQDPTRNPDKQSSSFAPSPSSVKQSVMGENSNSDPDRSQEDTKELAREIHWVEKATLWSQIGLGIIGVFALVVYHGQLAVMQGQLNEMRNSSRDATNQANRVINNMNWLAKEMHNSVEESRSSIEASQRQNQASIEAIREQNRPWIEITGLEPRNDPEGHSLAFSMWPNNTFEVYVFGSLSIKNVGHSVATNTKIGYEVVAVTRILDAREFVLKEQRRFCKSFLDGAIEPINPGILVFPDQPYRDDIGESARVRQRDLEYPDRIWDLAIVGCVDYQSTFSTKIHQTGFVYFVAHSGDSSGNDPFRIGKNLTANEARTYRLEAADYAK